MLNWRGDCTDGSIPGDPEEDPNMYGAPPGLTYDPTDPNDPNYDPTLLHPGYGGDPTESGGNPTDYPPDEAGGGGSSFLKKLLDGMGGNSGPTGNAGNVGSVLGGTAKSAQTQNNFQDTLRAQIAAAMERAKLDRQKFAVTAPGERLNSSVRASLASNFKPTTVKWGGPGSGLHGSVPTFEGGLSGALANLDPDTKALAKLVMSDQLGGEIQGGTTGGRADITGPPTPSVGDTSTLDKILGGGSLIENLIAAMTPKSKDQTQAA